MSDYVWVARVLVHHDMYESLIPIFSPLLTISIRCMRTPSPHPSIPQSVVVPYMPPAVAAQSAKPRFASHSFNLYSYDRYLIPDLTHIRLKPNFATAISAIAPQPPCTPVSDQALSPSNVPKPFDTLTHA